MLFVSGMILRKYVLRTGNAPQTIFFEQCFILNIVIDIIWQKGQPFRDIFTFIYWTYVFTIWW